MAMPDVNDLSFDELKQLEKNVAKAIKSFEARRRKEALAAAEAAAKERGFSLSQLIGAGTVKQKTVAAPKYQHPENLTLTWSGRGRKPAWFVAALEDGKTPDDLLIA
ncbi:H-NS family nucleoid-associated regulatory protein [Thalassococcus sp. S3]|uniref:H-NS histone family protein n=1 Tax=Thalassococcus sp. S3 TaxID=2017482 RepID=UPI00102416E7|nr:H-NS histone family protein [Thalassococcus sp. S3]QBF30074.1 transcriptional regulator [Thalassococcus sp. S3]